jgi:hypothetical protein
MKISGTFARLANDRERRDRTPSGEVEADKLAGPAHALLSK